MVNIKKLIIAFFIFFLLFSFFIGSLINIIFTKDKSTNAEKVTLPKTKLETLANKKRQLNKISTPTLLIFYLPQSPTCQEQLKVLSTIYNKDVSFNIIAIAIGDIKEEKLKEIKTKNNIPFEFLIDSKAELTEQLKVTTIPTLVFYHPQQQLKYKEGLSKEKELNKLIQKNLIKK